MAHDSMFDISGYNRQPATIGSTTFQKLNVNQLDGVFVGNGHTVVLDTSENTQYTKTFSTEDEAQVEAALWVDRINDAK